MSEEFFKILKKELSTVGGNGMTISGSFVYADYGDAEIVTVKDPRFLATVVNIRRT